jgi:hypothetical protein
MENTRDSSCGRNSKHSRNSPIKFEGIVIREYMGYYDYI